MGGIADRNHGCGGLHASSTFSSASRLASSSILRPSISRPCVERVVVCSELLPLKSISKRPSVQLSTLYTASSPRREPKSAWLIWPSLKNMSQRSPLLLSESRQVL